MCRVYRVTLDNADQNRKAAKTRLKMPVLAVGSEYFIGADNERQMYEPAEDVSAAILPWGHQLVEEDSGGLTAAYLDFLGRGD